ncbi:MAG: hypothetical protein IJ264_03480 [Clostridia bacterium]|nr:hypothetical protein [Clostridia bacterium]
MNEITSAVRVVNTALRTVRVIDVIKKLVVALAALLCCIFALRFWRK